MADKYTIVFANNSTRRDDFCIFQQGTTLNHSDPETVAWKVQAAAATTRVSVQWKTDADFVWFSKNGEHVISGQAWPVDKQREVDFTFDNDVFTFQNQTSGVEGSLTVNQSSTIPANRASVGIGMDGDATSVVPAQPNLSLIFKPSVPPQYWISFASYTQGQVLDVETIHDKKQVEFPVNVYSMTAILNSDNTWTIKSTADVDAAYEAAIKVDPDAQWGVLSDAAASAPESRKTL